MGTNSDKRARQRQNREASRPTSATRTRRPLMVLASVLAVVAVVVLVVLFVGGNDSDKVKGSATGSSSSTTAAGIELPQPPPGLTLTEPTPCPPAQGSAKRVQVFASAPPMCIDPAKDDYVATFKTTKGSFTAALDTQSAPLTVNNFVVLSRYHYYDGVPFHRVVGGFVIQAGDGDGEPWGNNDLGYTIEDELPTAANPYDDYSLAMANSGPNTNGSQFFVVLPGGGAQLGPTFSRFGQVIDGRDVVDAIGALGGGPNDKPTEVVLIDSVQITETPRAN